MDNNQKIIFFDGLLYLLTTFYWLLKLKKINAGLIVLAIMAMSHFGALFYYTVLSDLGLLEEDIQVTPFVYLYAMITMGVYPFLKHKGISKVDDTGIEKPILMLSIFVIAISIEPLLENIYILLTSSEDYGDVYEDMRDGELKIYSTVGTTLGGWSNHLRIFVAAALFYYLSKKDKKYPIIFGLTLCALNHILFWVNGGQRGGMMSQLIIYALTFVLFMPTFNPKMIRKLKKVLLWSSIPIILMFSAITLSRFNNGGTNKTLLAWILLYTSEGPIKFNTEMWDGDHNTNGDVNVNFLKDLLGMKTFTTYEDRDDFYMGINGRRIEVFYTYVGDFLSDFGYIGAALVCTLLFCLTRKLLSNGGTIPFHRLLLIIYIIHMYSIGFASNVYRAYSLQKDIFYIVNLYLILAFFYRFTKSTTKLNNITDTA